MQNHKILAFSKNSSGGIGTFLKQVLQLNNNQINLKVSLYNGLRLKKRVTNSRPYLGDNTSEYFTAGKTLALLKDIYSSIKTILKERPSLILTCDQYSSFVLLLIKSILFHNLKIITLINTNMKEVLENKQGFLYRKILTLSFKLLYDRADAIIFVSNQLALKLTKYFNIDKKKSIVIHNGVPTPKKESNNTRNLINKKKFVITSLGRLDKQKDFETIIKAFAMVIKMASKIKLNIIGDGRLKIKLKKLVINLKLKNSVTFFGWKNDINYYLKKSDLFVFSSSYEGFGRVIIEAMSHGLPIISTNTPYGPSEILDKGKYGILVPMRDEKKMSEAILELIKNPSLRERYSKLALDRVRYFDLKKTLKQYERVFLKTIRNEKNN
jgi:glycosyltransferase involved in cell wall biosynthesis